MLTAGDAAETILSEHPILIHRLPDVMAGLVHSKSGHDGVRMAGPGTTEGKHGGTDRTNRADRGFGGKPIVRDMRISVELVLSLLAQGVTPEAILDDLPDLEPDDIRVCTAYAHAVIARDTLSAVTVGEP